MNFKARIMILSTILILLLQIQSFAATIPFTDINDSPAKEKIISLQDRGILKGTGDNAFSPEDTITASQGVQLIVNALGLNLNNVRFIKEPKATDYFVNADNDAWYANAFIIAAVKGMVFPTDLDPGKEWSREEFTHYLILSIEAHYDLPKIKLIGVNIADEALITAEYSGSIQRSLAYGIVSLDSESKVNPKGEMLREEAAVQIYNALEYIKASVPNDSNLLLSKGNIEISYVEKAPSSDAGSITAIYTEDEVFNMFNTDIFMGTVKEVKNIRMDIDGTTSYSAIAKIAIEKNYRGSSAAGDTVSVMLPGPVENDFVIGADENITPAMKAGDKGIFMPIKYGEGSYWEDNNIKIYYSEIVQFGIMDTQRFVFLETKNGLMFARDTFPAIESATTLQEVEAFIEKKIQ